MKLTSLLLSSAAVLIAGTAYAADLPSKKAAPANYVKVCDAFGAGFFTIPGGDTCLQISGFARSNVNFSDTKSDRTKSPTTWTGVGRLNFDARSNTDLGVLRSFVRIHGSTGGAVAADYAYVQLGGLTAGYADSAFLGWNGDNDTLFGGDDSSVVGALQYTASLGGSTSATIAVEDASAHNNGFSIAADSTTTPATAAVPAGVAQIPDFVANVKTTQGPLFLQLSGAAHQNYGATSGSSEGFAVQGYAKYSGAAGTTLYAQATYADAALKYLGSFAAGTDYESLTIGNKAKGYAGILSLAQTVGSNGTINVMGGYGVVNPAASGSKDVKTTEAEVNFAYSPVKNLTVTPAVYWQQTDDGTTKTNSTSGLLRIERDF